jgi:cell division protein FtsL
MKTRDGSAIVQPILLLVVLIFSAGGAYFAYHKIQFLTDQNRSLTQKSKELQSALSKLQDENKKITEQSLKDKNALRDSIEFLKKENESIRFSLQKNEIRLTNAVEEKKSLEEMLVNKSRELDNLKQSPQNQTVPAPAAPAPIQGPDDLVQQIKQKDQEIVSLKNQNRALSDKLDKLYKTTNEKIAEINIAKIALEETVTQARKKISDEWNTVNLGTIQMQNPPSGAAASGAEAKKYPKKEGKILAINDDRGFVVVDLGRIDNINSDTQMVVMRNGSLLATLTMLEVRDIMSACNVKELQQGQKLQLNDQVIVKK